jgi:hypothetical protein
MNQGPAFAILGAWLMYQIQNRDVIENHDSDNLFKKAIIITALGFILCNLGPIDEWYVWLTLFRESILIDITQKNVIYTVINVHRI